MTDEFFPFYYSRRCNLVKVIFIHCLVFEILSLCRYMLFLMEKPERKIKNALVSGNFTLCTKEDREMLSRLIIKTGNATENSTSDAWRYFGPLYCKF